MNYDLSKIRIKCAEIVGWHKHDCGDPICWKLGTGIMGITRSIHDLPNYPESADAALELAAWMAKPENGGWWVAQDNIVKGTWRVAFQNADELFDGFADTFPLAVCLAFLKANNIDPETL